MTIMTSQQYDILECYKSMIDLVPTVALRFSRNIGEENAEDYSDCIINGYNKTKEYLEEQISKGDYRLIFGMLNGDDVFGNIILRTLAGSTKNCACEGLVARFTVTKRGIFPCSPASDENIFVSYYFEEKNDFFNYSIYNTHCLKCFARCYCGGECPLVFKMKGKPDFSLCKIRRALLDFAIELSCFLMQRLDKLEKIKEFIKAKIKRYNIVP